MNPHILLPITAILSPVSAQQLIPSMTATSNLTTPLLPLAPGTLENCDVYRSYEPSLVYGYSLDCMVFLHDDRVRVNQFMQWNPSTAVTGCHVQPGVRYCVVRDHLVDHEAYDTGRAGDSCGSVDYVVPGTSPWCTCFTIVFGYESGEDGYTCALIAEDFEIDVARLLEWNTWLGGDCDGDLYRGLGEQEERGLCVAVNGSLTVD